MENENVELKVELNVEEVAAVVKEEVAVVEGEVAVVEGEVAVVEGEVAVVEGEPKNEKKPQRIKLTDVEITESTYVNFLAGMLKIAQCRGAFGFEESSKIYECIKFIATKQLEKRALAVTAVEEEVEKEVETAN